MKAFLSFVTIIMVSFGALAQESDKASQEAVRAANLVRIPGIANCLNKIETESNMQFLIRSIDENAKGYGGTISGMLILGGDMVRGKATVTYDAKPSFPSFVYTCTTSVTLF